jgi:hypothetical protein
VGGRHGFSTADLKTIAIGGFEAANFLHILRFAYCQRPEKRNTFRPREHPADAVVRGPTAS